MKHLTDREIVDLIDHRLAPDRMAHAAECVSCGARAELARDVLMRVDEADVPEPSPLFWEHFSARVREGVAGETPASSWRLFLQQPATAWVVSAALLIVVSGGVWLTTRTSIIKPAAATVATNLPNATNAVLPDADDALGNEPADQDVAWGLVRTVADELSWDDTVDAGLGTTPGSADRAIGSLTSAERAELIVLLEAEAKKPGA
jgi:hypothetical protein